MKKNFNQANSYIDTLLNCRGIGPAVDIAKLGILEMASRLDEAEANLEQARYLHIIQYEEGGIPQEPFVTSDIETAGREFERVVTENQCFRKKREDETWDDYEDQYCHMIAGPNKDWTDEDREQWNEMEGLDDVCHWWRVEVK